jgi:hypothetical protein
MIKYCLDKWNENSKLLESIMSTDKNLTNCDYSYLVKLVVANILNAGSGTKWDAESITEIDDGDCQGTLLYVIPEKCYQPSEYEYLITFVGYGSCSGCDTLQYIQDLSYNDGLPTPEQLKEYMALCRDLIANMTKPYNYGWRNKGEFVPVEEA